MNLDWQDLAACRGMDTNLFFCETTGPKGPHRNAEAYAACARCPVVLQCAEYGRDDQYGIFGGRAQTSAGKPFRSNRDLQPHGTEAAYKRHQRDGEPACRSCQQAANLASAVRYSRKERTA